MRKLLHIFPALFIAGCTANADLDLSAVAKDRVVHELVTKKAQENDVPVRLAHAIVKHESNYNPKVRGRQGEIGLGQIKCQTARGVGFSGSCNSLYDPETNLTYSMKYLRVALDKAGNNECHAATLYNAGLGARLKSSAYCRKIMAHS